jgi:hypothetical protein
MSKYYILENACDTEETGPEYPQVQKMGKGYDYNAPDSVWQLSNDIPKFIPNFDHFVLHKRAKASDFISKSLTAFGFIVSGRFKKTLSSFKLPEHKFYRIKMLHNKTWLDDYHWLQIACDLTEYVDYQKSEFYIRNLADPLRRDLGAVELLSKTDFELKRKEVRAKNSPSFAISPKRIMMNNSFDRNLDFFEISGVNNDIFISDRLSQAIQEAKLTGIRITPTQLVNLPYPFEIFN